MFTTSWIVCFLRTVEMSPVLLSTLVNHVPALRAVAVRACFFHYAMCACVFSFSMPAFPLRFSRRYSFISSSLLDTTFQYIAYFVYKFFGIESVGSPISYVPDCYTSYQQCDKTPTSKWRQPRSIIWTNRTRRFLMHHRRFKPTTTCKLIVHQWKPLLKSDWRLIPTISYCRLKSGHPESWISPHVN